MDVADRTTNVDSVQHGKLIAITVADGDTMQVFADLSNKVRMHYLSNEAGTIASSACEGNRDYLQNIDYAKELGFTLDDSDLSKENKESLLAFLGQNRDVFARNLSELGTTNVHNHYIDTGDAPAQRSRFYRTSPQVKAEIERQVDEMLQNDISEPSVSPWHSPVVMVRKKKGEFRFAVDYRKLNKVTQPMFFPLPRLDDVFDAIGGAQAQVFSVLDLASGFWQIPLDERTQHKSAFVTHHGIFQFKKLPFGLMNAPMSFQLVMAEVLRGINWKYALVYVDDIIIFSSNFTQHL
ncbi:Retrovirus-related Pol polyprotein from transposon [Apostichopus japonicus]|uniref:Retrovirus-related Pol polyprotein from transposon n=1 Tax=Stichopus japonicus TaxID=307972 RepID=A0A2G8KQB3_STIJA|nr:Retrovirus-related Pol polyprotein from transposon [Apostichopus japonicus]